MVAGDHAQLPAHLVELVERFARVGSDRVAEAGHGFDFLINRDEYGGVRFVDDLPDVGLGPVRDGWDVL